MGTAKKQNDEMVQQHITPNLLLDIFDEPIIFHKAYVQLTEDALAALFLSYATYTAEKLENHHEGWFTKTYDEWQAETGLTRFQQRSARKILIEKGLLIERKIGMPAKLMYKIDMEELLYQLNIQANQNWG